MNSSITRFSLDLHSAQSQISIPVLLGDTSRAFHISLSDGGRPYTIEDGCLAKLSIRRPTGTHLEEFCTIENNTTIVYSFDQNENTAAVEGIHDCDITLYGLDGKSIGSPKFSIVVDERVIRRDDINVTDDDKTVIDAMIQAEASRQYAESSRVIAETLRVEAETSRSTAETARALAEADRIAAEKERLNAGKIALESAKNAKLSEENAKASEVASKLSEGNAKASENTARDFADSALQSAGEANESAEISRQIASDMVNIKTRGERNDKRITNLEKGIPSELFVTDSSVAHIKDVPANALPYAEVTEVGGVTRECTNILDYGQGAKSSAHRGITFTNNGDGSITVNGTHDNSENLPAVYYIHRANVNPFSLKENMNYTVSGADINKVGVCVIDENGKFKDTLNSKSRTFTIEDGSLRYGFYLYVFPGATINNVTVYPMLNEGTTALPFEPYFEGLKSAKVTAIESVGANLLLYPYPHTTKTENGVTWTDNGDGSITASGIATGYSGFEIAQFSFDRDVTLALNGTNVLQIVGSICVYDESGELLEDITVPNTASKTVKKADYPTAVLLVIVIKRNGNSAVSGTFYPMLNYGDTALPFVPYRDAQLPIPTEIQALDGYGESNPNNAAEYNYIDFEQLKFIAYGHIVDGSWVAFDAVQETDISHLITADNFIEVEGGGTITAVNENSFAVPSEITYMLKEDAV